MAEAGASVISDADIRSVARKLEDFCDHLTPGEQLVMGWLLRRVSAPDEIRGYEASPLSRDDVHTAIGGALGVSTE